MKATDKLCSFCEYYNTQNYVCERHGMQSPYHSCADFKRWLPKKK